MRYFTLYRPPMPGAVPKGFTGCGSFSERTYIERLHRSVWGWVEYDQPLSDADIRDYELLPDASILDNQSRE